MHWRGEPLDWKDESILGSCAVAYLFHNHLQLAMRLVASGPSTPEDLVLRTLPWRPLCDHVFRHGARPQARALRNAAELREYLADWSNASPRVRAILKWDYSPLAMCQICRLGAWLGDVANTERCVRAGKCRRSAAFVAVHNASYKKLADMLGWKSGWNSSPNNVGNLFEHLMWLALEDCRCEWILGVLRCLDVDGSQDTDGASAAGPGSEDLGRYSSHGASQPAAGSSAARPRPRSRSRAQHSEEEPEADFEVGENAEDLAHKAMLEHQETQLRHALAEAHSRYIEAQNLFHHREWVRHRNASQPAGKGPREEVKWTARQLELLAQYDNGALLRARDELRATIGGNTGGGSERSGSRRVVPGWHPGDPCGDTEAE